MKKAVGAVFICVIIMVFALGTGYAAENKEKDIEGISTVVGSYCHGGFVPHNVAVFGGDLVVSDKDNHRLNVIDIGTSRVTMTYGRYGEGKRELRFPRGLLVNGKELLVCDSYNNRIVFLNTDYKPVRILSLKKSPKDICALEDKLYVLLADGATVESYEIGSGKYVRSFSLKYNAEYITGTDSRIIAVGGGRVNTVDVETVVYEEEEKLKGAISVNALQDSIYVLFGEKAEVYDRDFEKTDEFRVNKGSFIYPTEGGVYIADQNKGLVYLYKKGNIVQTYGKERKPCEPERISVRGNRVAVKSEDEVYIYKEGKAAVTIDGKGVVDIKLWDNVLYILKSNSIVAYELVSHETGEISARLKGNLQANSAYRFTAMEMADGIIYICEAQSKKLLKVGTDLRVFSTAIGRIDEPKAVAVGNGRIYIAEKDCIGVYDFSGNLTGQVAGEYSALSFSKELFAVNHGDKKVDRISDSLELQKPLEYEGYFLGLADLEAKEYGLYICDYSRREVMIYTDESLEISSRNASVDGKEFKGTVKEGQSVSIRVTGAGMLNLLPNIGDVRYEPISCGVDKEIAFKEGKGWFNADVSMPSIGNYTLKIKYQKQIYSTDGWKKVQAANGTVIKELPVTVTQGLSAVGEGNREDVIKRVLDKFISVFIKG